MFKKTLITLIALLSILHISCFADDIIEDTKIDTNIIDETIETAASTSYSPSINSRAAIVIDRNSKKILYGKNENTRRAMASTTKIMTALVVIENTDLNNIVAISKKAAGTGGSRLKLKTGDKISVKDLLYGLMLRSGNDSAVALAEYVGGSTENFANMMNEKAIRLNLLNTHFITPHGLDKEEHYTTAYELAIITDYALNNPIFSKIVNTKVANITINDKNRTIANTNELLGNLEGVYGVKTGFTNGAGRCLVTSVKRDNMDIICIVLGADTKNDRTKDSVKLIEYSFKNYETVSLNNKVTEYFENWNNLNNTRINIEKGTYNYLDLKLNLNDEEICYPIYKDTQNEIRINILSNLVLKAPIVKNSEIGKLQIIYQGKIIKEIPIINENTISKKGIINYLSDFFKKYNTYLQKVI